ncbi:MAG: DHCW motif cupin fold protein [Anaerolineae bacterium]
MKIPQHAFHTTEWQTIESTFHKGERGQATWQTLMLGDIRIRKVEYSPGYLADHWCSKGHVILCLEGEMQTELEDGRVFTLKAGMTYQVGDESEAHRSSTRTGCKLFIVD